MKTCDGCGKEITTVAIGRIGKKKYHVTCGLKELEKQKPKRKTLEKGKCGICGKETNKGWRWKGKQKVFYCGCQGRRCG